MCRYRSPVLHELEKYGAVENDLSMLVAENIIVSSLSSTNGIIMIIDKSFGY